MNKMTGKVDYYRKRVKDKSLTVGQREYAQGFLNGYEDSSTAWVGCSSDSYKINIAHFEKANKRFENAKYNGYGHGTLTALKDLLSKVKK